jgi:putative membrane protein
MADSSRNPLTLARFELRRFKGPLPRLALAFILLIPMLYGCIYLAGNWDPYGRLDQVPVAIVNHDVPTTVKGKEVAAGRDFVDSLHRTATFDFVDSSAADAERGLERGDFYLVITVPETFSRDLVSAQDLDPRRAGIELRRNDANGFVIGTITNSAQNSPPRARAARPWPRGSGPSTAARRSSPTEQARWPTARGSWPTPSTPS